MRYVDNSSFLVPDEVFVPGSVFSRRYGMDPEVLGLWNQIPKDKRPTYGLRKSEKQFTQSETELWDRIQTKLGREMGEYTGLERNRSFSFEVLTTPVAYLTRVPRDPFNKNFLGYYRYGTPAQGAAHSPANYSSWMLLSNGPDKDEDINPSYVVLDDRRQPVLYSGYPFEGKPRPLQEFVYDPTNGTQSDGDIVRFGP